MLKGFLKWFPVVFMMIGATVLPSKSFAGLHYSRHYHYIGSWYYGGYPYGLYSGYWGVPWPRLYRVAPLFNPPVMDIPHMEEMVALGEAKRVAFETSEQNNLVPPPTPPEQMKAPSTAPIQKSSPQ